SELVDVGRREGRGLVDRDAGRDLGHLGCARGGADRAGREAPRFWTGSRLAVAHGAMLHRSRRPPAAWCRHARHAVLAGTLRVVHRAVGADDQLVCRPPIAAYDSRIRAVRLMPTTATASGPSGPNVPANTARTYPIAAAAVRPTVIGGETTRAAPPTISGNAKKNGLATPPVSATRRVATV